VLSSFVGKNILQKAYHCESYPASAITYLSDESVRDEETTTGVEFRGGSLTPLRCFIPAILQNPLVIRNIQNDPRIGGLKLVVYECVVYQFFIGLLTDVVIYQAETRIYQEALLFCKHKVCSLVHPKSANIAGRSRSKWVLHSSMVHLSRTMYPCRDAYGISSRIWPRQHVLARILVFFRITTRI
jgi:hypothetical protein